MRDPAVPTLPRDDSMPGTLPEFMRKFDSEEACADVVRRWKYPEGFRCPAIDCGHPEAWYLPSRELDECKKCGHQVSLTAGTILHKSKKPLRLWFTAMFLFASSKQGISALELKRQLGVSYQTAWAWLHKLRFGVGARATSLLTGTVETDETYIGGVEEGRGGRSTEKKVPVAATVEAPRTKKHLGRVRLVVLEDATEESLSTVVSATVDEGAYVVTDGWSGYKSLAEHGFRHRSINVKRSGQKAHAVLPGVHRVFSLLRRLLLGTYQGAASRKHLQAYAHEFQFRFNRRRSASRALVFQRLLSTAMACKALPYWLIVGRSGPMPRSGRPELCGYSLHRIPHPLRQLRVDPVSRPPQRATARVLTTCTRNSQPIVPCSNYLETRRG